MSSIIQTERYREPMLPAAVLRAPVMASNATDNRGIAVKDRSIQPTDPKGEQKEGYRKVVIRNLPAGMKFEEFFDLIPGWITAEKCLFHYYMPGKVASNKAKVDSPSTAYIGFVSEEVADNFRVSFMKNIAQTFSVVPMVEPAPYQGKVKLPLSSEPKESWKEDSYFAEYKKWLKNPSLPRPVPAHSNKSKPVSSVKPGPASSGKKAGKAKGKKKGHELDREGSSEKDEGHESSDAPKLSRKAAKRERAALKQQKKAASTTSETGGNHTAATSNSSETKELTSGSVMTSSKSSKRKNKPKEKQKERKEDSTIPTPASQEKKKPKKIKKPKPPSTDSGTPDATPLNQSSEAAVVDNAAATSQQSDSPKPEKKIKKTKKKPKSSKLSPDASDEITQQAKKPAKLRKVKENRTTEKQLRGDEKLDTENQQKPARNQVNSTEVKSG